MRVFLNKRDLTAILFNVLAILLTVQCTSPSVAQGTSEFGAGAVGRGSDASNRGLDAAPSSDTYLLDTGDRLNIRFYDRYDRADLNGEYVIGESGQLRLPRVGAFNAKRKTPAQLERDIREVLEGRGEKLGYFSVDVSRCRPFYILGLVDHPGSYPFSPGFTVLHAISTAGGLYRQSAGERLSIADTLSRRAALLARRARLQAEKDGSPTIPLPKELVQLKSSDATDMIAREQSILEQSRQVSERERNTLETIVGINHSEVENYNKEIVKLEQRIAEQMQTYTQLKKLHEDKVINQQRFFELVAALDNLQRDRRSTGSNLSQANSNLEIPTRPRYPEARGERAHRQRNW